MKSLLKGIVRFVGTCTGIVGVVMVVSGVVSTVSCFREPRDAFHVFLGIFKCVGVELFGVYFVYVAIVVWWRFSPAAVHHVCVALGLWLFSFLLSLFSLPDAAPPPKVQFLYFLAFVALGAISYLAFRLCRFILRRALFPAQKAYQSASANAG